ncbi:MAG: hypothetical protein JSW15_07580 [Deltaproteobacteria bacterium]|nr:MAG: hypothetical protein JSW15_07580 [Deltaproteobacteria bacterium]
MPKPISKRLYILLGSLFIAPLIILYSACQFHKAPVPEEKPSLPKIRRLVVVGFLPAMSQWDEPDVVRSPVSGAVFFAEPVPQQAVNKMTANLFERTVKDKRYDLISPGQARGVYSSLVSSDMVLEEIEILQKIGEAFSANAVLIGYLYRWREREGTDFAVSRPASAAFDLYLIRPVDGAILWKGRFDKTQKALSENILDIDTFLKGQGRWMTVERLAEVGLGDLLGKLLEGERGEKD